MSHFVWSLLKLVEAILHGVILWSHLMLAGVIIGSHFDELTCLESVEAFGAIL